MLRTIGSRIEALYSYETDPDAAAAVLPAQMKLTDPPMVRMIFAHYQWSSIGFYNEVAQSLTCTYKGKPYVYPVRLHVTSDRAMAAGREMGGFPKKIGRIEFNCGAEYFSYLDSPEGLRVCSGVMIPGQRVGQFKEGDAGGAVEYISLRVMPNPTDTKKPFKPALCELMSTVWELGPGEMWSATGSVHLNGTSDLDPYHRLPVVDSSPSNTNPMPCALYRGDMTVSKVKLLEQF
jgi:acetoacetate decarboxylase